MIRQILPLFSLASVLFGLGIGTPAGASVDFRIELGWRSAHASDYNAAVVLYEYDHYRGRQLVLYPGESLHDFSDFAWGFRVRSVRVLGPVHVTLYDQSGHWGHEVAVYGDVPDLQRLRMRLSAYSLMHWGGRARSAYASYNPSGDVCVSIDWYQTVLPRTYWGSPVRPHFAPPPPRFRPVLPRPQPNYRPAPPPRYTPSRGTAPGTPPAARPPRPGPPPSNATPPRSAPPPRHAVPPPPNRPPAGGPPSGAPGGGRPPSAPPPPRPGR